MAYYKSKEQRKQQMTNLTARYFALLYLEEMAEESEASWELINQQLPTSTKIVADILDKDPEIGEYALSIEFARGWCDAFCNG